MKYFTYQGNDKDCGFASLKMLLAMKSKNESYLYIPKPEKKEQYTGSDLINIAKTYGVNIELSKCDIEYLNIIKTPCLVIINFNHVVLLKKITKHFVVIYDPAEGKRILKRNDFLKVFSHLVFEIEDDPEFDEIKIKKLEIIPKKLRIFESIISLLSSLILIVCFYLLNNTENVIYSFIFVGLFLSAQFAENYVMFKQIYHFDKIYSDLYFSIPKNQNKIGYLEFEGFKQEYFTKNRTLLSSIIATFLITFLLVFNDFRNGFVLIALILLNLLERVLFQKYDKKEKDKINEFEMKFLENPAEKMNFLNKANFHANMYVFKSKIKNLITIVLSFVFAILMMVITGNSGCNFVIFHFGLYYIGSTSCSSVISSLSDYIDLEKSEARFLDKCNL